MKKWNLIVDIAKCNNCANCQVANMDEYQGNTFEGYSAPMAKDNPGWFEIKRVERGTGTHVDVAYMPTMCNHCDSAPCIEEGDAAVKKRADGIVLIDPIKAKGRRDLIAKCPYGAMSWNEALQLPQIWTFDAHLLDAGWQQTRSEQACPTRALQTVKATDEEMNALVRSEALETASGRLNTQPRVYYKNLHRFNKRLLAGTLVGVNAEGRRDCLENISVDLYSQGSLLASEQTDEFGDFRFDRLPDHEATYKVLFSHPVVKLGFEKEVVLNQRGLSLGEIHVNIR